MVESHELDALLVRLADVQKLTSLSRSRIYELMRCGFPRPIKIGASSFWVRARVVAYIEKCIADNEQR